MGRIAKKAEALDAALRGLDDRLGVLDNSHDNMATNWERRSKKMSREFRQDIHGMRSEMSSLSTFMGGFDRKKTIKVDADTTRAMAKIRAVHMLAGRNATMGVGANNRGGLGGLFGGGQGGGLGGALGSATRNANHLGGALDRVGVNLGPISTRLSSIPMLLAGLGGPVLGAASSGISVLTGAVSALGAAAIGGASMLGAFTFGIGSIAIPATLAGKRIAAANKEVVKAQKALDRATPRTRAYERAQRRLAEAKSHLSKNDRELLTSTHRLSTAWDKMIMKGRSGQRVVSMMNEAVGFAAKQMPWVAQMFDKFTLSGLRLFRMANAHAPKFRRQLSAATDEWPDRFEDGAKSAGHLASGLLGVVDAAEPFTAWLSGSLLKGTERFDRWANSQRGDRGIGGWLKDMQPILSAMGRLGMGLGGSIIEVSRRDQDDIVYFIDQITEGVKKLPGFIDKWSDRFHKIWPTVRGFFGDMGDFIDYTWRGFEKIEGYLDALDRPLGSIHDTIKKIAGLVPEGLGVLLMGGLATKWGRNKLWNLVPGVGGKDKGMGPAGALGKAVDRAVKKGDVIPVYVVNMGGKMPPTAVPHGPHNRPAGGWIRRGGAWVAAAARTAAPAAAPFAPLIAAEAIYGHNVRRADQRMGTIPMSGIPSPTAAAATAAQNGQGRAFDPRTYNDLTNAQFNSVVGNAGLFGMLTGTRATDLMKGVKESIGKDGLVSTLPAARRTGGGLGGALVAAFGKKMLSGEMSRTFGVEVDRMGQKRVDLGGFFSDLWSSFTSGVSALGDIVHSVTGPLDTFWSALTGGGSGTAPSTPRTPPSKKRGTGDSRKGAGIGARAVGAIGSVLGAGKGLASRAINWLSNKGQAGRRTASGLNMMQNALTARMGDMFSSGGAASATGLLPQAAGLAQQMAQMFGVRLTSGYRGGAITESGNLSLHALGRAVDLGGNPAQMQSVWNYLLGKGGINELIYAGKIAENGGPPRPYNGADKHYDHVHVGIGDSRRGSGVPAHGKTKPVASISVSFAGAQFHISTGDDYRAVMEKLASELERAVESSGLSASEMIDG